MSLFHYILIILLCFISACGGAETGRNKGVLKPFAKEGATKQALRGKRYALVVGINQFTDTKFGNLHYAEKDAKAISAAFKDFDQVWTLASKATTTRANILQHLAMLKSKVRSKHDTIVVYFSTHGTLGQRPGKGVQRYLVASDTRLALITQTGISVRYILNALNTLRSRKRALILASCHSGRGKSKLSDSLAKVLAKNKGINTLDEVSEASFVISATAFKEVAREEDALKHDVYTYFFLQGIQRGDRDRDGAVTISEAHDYARSRTYQYTKGTQRPVVTSTILGRDPIILKGRILRRPKPVIYSYQKSSEGIEIKLNGRSKGVLPGGIVVKPGTHDMVLIDSQTKEVLYTNQITLRDGQRLELTQLIQEKPWFHLEVGGGIATFLDAKVREQFIPTTLGWSVAGSVNRWPWSWSWIGVSLSNWRGDGQIKAFDLTVPYAYNAWQTHLSLGARWEILKTLDVATGMAFGVWHANRQFMQPQYVDSETFTGLSGGVLGMLSWRVYGPWTISLKTRVGLLRAPLGQSDGPFATTRTSLWTGIRF